MAAPESSTESTDRLAEKVRYIEDSSFEQSEPDPAIPQGGFECQFVKQPPESVQYECPVCQLVLREPYVVDCCGQNFCRACIKRIQADEKPCPTCKQSGFLAISDQKHQRSLYPLRVQCSHEKEGCQWIGQLGELDKHLNENPKPDEQLLGCEYAKICCVHCSELFLRPSIATHQREECPRRPFSCVFCRSYESSHEDVVNSHWHVCDCYPVSCPNQCGVEPERQNLEHHVSSECPLTVVNCDFRYVGCEVKLPRKDMPAHITDNLVVHMSLLAIHSQKENVQLKEELVDFRKQLDVQSQKTAKENVELRKQLEARSQKTVKENDELKKELAGLRQQMKVGIGGLIGVAVVVSAIVLSHIWQTADKQAEPASLHQEMEWLKEEQKYFEQKIEKLMKLDLSQQIHGSGSKEEIEQLKRDMRKYIDQEMEAFKSKVFSSIAKEKQSNDGVTFDEPSLIASQIVPVEFIMTHFEKHKKGGDRWFSYPFYTSPAGYKMCLSVVANGVGSGKGTHVTVSLHLMQGEFDDDLKWPFRGDITVQLLNQLEDKEHHERTIQFTNNFPNHISGRVTKRNRAKRWSFNEFILYRELSFNCTHHYQYLKYDSLQFRVSKVELMHDVVPFHAIMKKFDSTSDNWYSDPFFTHPQGYRMSLDAAVNKDGLGGDKSLRKRVIIWVSIYILHGEYDDCLEWPFQGNITVQLLNQIDNKESFEQIVHFTDEAGSSDHFTTKERVEEIKGWKTLQFILTNSKLYHEFADDGSLHFQVSKVEMLEKTQERSFKCLYLFC